MNKDFWDRLALRLFGSAAAPSLLGTAIGIFLAGACLYCSVVRAVLFGFGLGLLMRFTVPASIIGVSCMLAAVILTAVERLTGDRA